MPSMIVVTHWACLPSRQRDLHPRISSRIHSARGAESARTPVPHDCSRTLRLSLNTEPTISDRGRHDVCSGMDQTFRHNQLRRTHSHGSFEAAGGPTPRTQLEFSTGPSVLISPAKDRWRWRAALRIRSTNSLEQLALAIRAREDVHTINDPYAHSHNATHTNAIQNLAGRP